MKDKNSHKQPLISVVIAMYNPKQHIQRCIESILKQTYKNIEIIAVDAITFPEDLRKEYKPFIEKHARYFVDGPERSIQRNRGIRQAKGEYILLLDQDMYLTGNVADDCYRLLTGKDYIALTIPEISIGEGYWTKCVALERYVSTVLEEGMNECCRFFRKIDAETIGGFDPSIVGAEDSDFHYRMKMRGEIGKIKSIIYHDEGETDFFGRVKKKYYYSRAFRDYFKKYPAIAAAQFSPFKKAYIKHWKLLLKNPNLTFGIFFLRTAEVAAGFFGLLIKKNNYEQK